MGIVEYIQQTTAAFFKIGIGGVTINNNSGVAEIKNAANDGLAKLRAADPTGDTDVATKGWAESNLNVADAVREMVLEVDDTDMPDTGTATIDTSNLPSGAVIQSIDIKVGTGFDGGATLIVGSGSDDDEFIAAGQVDLTYTANVQSFNLRGAPFASAAPVKFKFTTSGTPSAGSLSAYITYSVPTASA